MTQRQDQPDSQSWDLHNFFNNLHNVETEAPSGVPAWAAALRSSGGTSGEPTRQPVGPRHGFRQMTGPWPEIKLNKQDVKNYWT